MRLNPKDSETAIKLLQKEVAGNEASITSLNEKVYELESNGGSIANETDPTVPSWAKQNRKPYYSASEVGAVDVNNAISIEELSELF